MKAQAALEYLIMVSLALMILLPYILYSSQLLLEYQEENNLAMAKNAVAKIGQTADWVFSQGEPAKMSVEIFIPDGITSIQLLNKTIVFKIKRTSGISDVFYVSATNITGYLPTTQGYYIVHLSAENNNVRITV